MRAALIQLCVSDKESGEERFERVQSILSGLLKGGTKADLILLPELWKVGFSSFDKYGCYAEPLQGAGFKIFSRWAKRLNCTIVYGSFLEKRKNGEISNTSVLITPDGVRQAEYRKIHLFGYKSKETELLTSGKSIATAQTPIGKVGLALCYDLRFPEQFRKMTQCGAESFCVCASWPRERVYDWRTFCRVRAMENQCFLFGCNNAGTHCGVTGAGHSMVIAPDGKIIAEAGENEEILFAEFDPSQVRKTRESFPVLNDIVPI